ncbi:hypothetical protein ACFE04_028442 [Oxalis oulophora]
MAEEEHHKSESLMEKIADKIHGGDSSSSSSDSEDEKKKKEVHHEHNKASSQVDDIKSKVNRLFGRQKPLHKVLGGGKPADIFMWRDKKASGTLLGVATAIWVFFELFEYHLITLLCHIAIISLAGLFLWSNASTFINKSPPNIPQVQLPENCTREVASALRIEINRVFSVLRDIASGKDLKTFLAVIAGLWVLSIMGSCFNFLTLSYISFVLLFTVPVLYEKYEDQVDAFGEKAMIEIKKQYAVFDAKVLSQIPKGALKGKKKE